MTKSSCPVRSLIAIALLTVGWVVFLFSTSDPDDGGWLVPQQINSVVLSGLGYSALFAALVEVGRRRDRRTHDRLAALERQIADGVQQVAEVRQHVCPEPPQPGYVNGYIAGVAAKPDAKVLHLHS